MRIFKMFLRHDLLDVNIKFSIQIFFNVRVYCVFLILRFWNALDLGNTNFL